ncbi:1-phosphofructokinase family hexose kinase [Atopomonas sediminilitoris]|uniref:1-phosphofructokinase family hexose kinase n=1 Tax=Atopomonas sediminilitoris TaxID=2919919 RepID=UPI001F4EA65B|nr:hexose kinase [Atopomonas sediminilitoris]MCJ8169256.1 hexose kinase [Atopomonas sediminilitoris]
MPVAIVTLTLSPSLDKATEVPEFRPDSKLRCAEPVLSPGGGGVNVARALAALGVQALALLPAGGPYAAVMLAQLQAQGVHARALSVQAPLRECLNVRDAHTGKEFRLVMPGARLTAAEQDELLQALAALSGYQYLVISGSLAPECAVDVLIKAIDLARAAGARCVLDVPGEVLQAVLKQRAVYLIKPNVHELAALVGEPDLPQAHVAESAERLVVAGTAEVVIVSQGAQGALWRSVYGAGHQAAPAVERLSTVGAGDSLVAGFLAQALVQPPVDATSIAACVRQGVAAGSAATMTASHDLCRQAEVTTLLAAMPPVSHA